MPNPAGECGTQVPGCYCSTSTRALGGGVQEGCVRRTMGEYWQQRAAAGSQQPPHKDKPSFQPQRGNPKPRAEEAPLLGKAGREWYMQGTMGAYLRHAPQAHKGHGGSYSSHTYPRNGVSPRRGVHGGPHRSPINHVMLHSDIPRFQVRQKSAMAMGGVQCQARRQH